MIYVLAIVILAGIVMWGVKNLGTLPDELDVHDLKDSEVER